MPNTTSNKTEFDKSFSIEEIIEEAYQRVGIQNLTGYQLKSARRSLNIMFQEWANRGLHYWELKETNVNLVAGQSEYHFFRSAADDTSDTNRVQYYVQRFIDRVTVSVYPTPDTTAATSEIHLYFVKRIEDVGDYTNSADLPYRFVPCMLSGLAYYLAQKYNAQLVQQNKLLYEEEFNRALTEDGSSTSTYITPKVYYNVI